MSSSSAPAISSSSSVSSIVSSFHESISSTSSLTLLPSSRPFYFLSSTNTLFDALELLSARRILSAPVFDISKEICLGACDLFSIAIFLTKKKNYFHKKHETKEIKEELGKILLTEVMQIHDHTVSANLATFFEENPLSLLIDYFQTRRVHRVALISKSCELTHPCSQSDVIVWLHKQFHLKKYPELSLLNISQLITHLDDFNAISKDKDKHHSDHISFKKPITVFESTSVISSLELMNEKNISCLGVLNSTGQLIAQFSSSDLRGLNDFQSLNLPILEYLKKYSSQSLAPLFIHSNTTFSNFLSNLYNKKVHRGWLVDDTLCPIRVITLSDIIKFLASGNKITEETANGGRDVKKLWTAKLMDAGKPVSTAHLFEKTEEENKEGKLDIQS